MLPLAPRSPSPRVVNQMSLYPSLKIIFICVCGAPVWRSKENFQELILFFTVLGPRDQTEVISLCGRYSYLLNPQIDSILFSILLLSSLSQQHKMVLVSQYGQESDLYVNFEGLLGR